MKKQLARMLSAGLLSFGVVSTADAAFLGRLPATPGGTDYQAYYDPDSDTLWLANANLAASNTFGVVGINANGTMTWPTANNWIAAMNVDGGTGYLGINDWWLPTTTQPDATCSGQIAGVGFGFGCTGSEMGHLFNVDGVTTAAPDPFSNVQSLFYWSGSEFAIDPASAWAFNFDDGDQRAGNKGSHYWFAWAVRSGDVSAVPIPGAVWLFGSGLIGLLGLVRRKR